LNRIKFQPERAELWIACALFLGSFAWFAFHAVPSLYFGDGGELLAAIHLGGIPHPTGFPLLLLLGYVPSQTGTFAVNLMSSAMGALSVALVALWAGRLFGILSIFPAACVLLGSCTLTLHSSVVRVYPFQLATFAAVVLCVSFYKPNARWGLMFGFSLGLASTTHTLFLCSLVYAIVLLREKRRDLVRLVPWLMAGMILGASLYIWIPLRAHLQPGFAWAKPDGFKTLWSYMTQKQYGKKMFSRDLIGTWLFVRTIARAFWEEWNPLAWFLAAWGFKIVFRIAPQKACAIVCVILFNITLLYSYGYDEDLEILYRYFLPTYACVAILAATAAIQLYEKYFQGFAKPIGNRILLGVLFFLLFISYPAFRWSDLSSSIACRTYLNHVLRPLPQNSIAILAGDNQVFPCAYGQYVLGLRKDLHLVEWEGTVFPEAVHWLSATHSKLTTEQLEDVFYRNSGGCLFVSEHRVLPPPYHCRPWGFMYRLTEDESEKHFPPPPKPYWMPPRFTHAEKTDVEASGIFIAHYLMSAAWNDDRGNRDAALVDVADALKVDPNNVMTLINASIYNRKYNLNERAEKLLMHALAIQPGKYEALLNLGILYDQMGRYDDSRRYLLLADKKKPNESTVQYYLQQIGLKTRRPNPL
jgi:tetratricopeptide (TPR) repeat protein